MHAEICIFLFSSVSGCLHVCGYTCRLHMDSRACACGGPRFMLRICFHWSYPHLIYHRGMLSSSDAELVCTVSQYCSRDLHLYPLMWGSEVGHHTHMPFIGSGDTGSRPQTCMANTSYWDISLAWESHIFKRTNKELMNLTSLKLRVTDKGMRVPNMQNSLTSELWTAEVKWPADPVFPESLMF